jgi:nucleotide-binding universal stress UspA family protein
MYQKILLAYDGSESGRKALLECGDVANLMHAQIKLLAVIPLMSPVYVGEGFIPVDPIDDNKQQYQDVLDEGVRTLTQRGFVVEGQLNFGEPAEEIARVAKEWSADLIVIARNPGPNAGGAARSARR